MNAVLYTRISGADIGRTADDALGELRRYTVEVRSWQVVVELADVGPGLRGRREALLSLVERVKAGKVAVVVTDSLARLCRNLSHLADLAALFKEHGVEIVAVQDLVDTTTLDGRARWMEATDLLGRIQKFQRSEAVRFARIKEAVGADDNWGRPIAVINPLELAGYFHGRVGAAPLSIRKMSRKMGVAQATLRKRISQMVEAGQLDPSERLRRLEEAGGLPRGGRPSRARIDDERFVASWNAGMALSSMSRDFRCSKEKVRLHASAMRGLGRLDDEQRGRKQAERRNRRKA